nr:MAG TPA: hypothetical protein [Caudoviricetes sp.]
MNLIDLRYIDNLKDLDLDTVDISKPAPEFEMIRAAAPEDDGARQYYFIEQAKILWKQQFESLADSGETAGRYESELLLRLQAEGKYGTFHIATFGCPIV